MIEASDVRPSVKEQVESLGGKFIDVPYETDEEREMRSPRWIAPIVTWLASDEAAGVTGRIFEASGQTLAIAEGWHRGPSHAPVEDPTTLGPIVAELLAQARPNAGMDGRDGSWPQSAR